MSEKLLPRLEKAAAKGLKELNVPGVAVAVVKDGKMIYSAGFGYADLEKKVKMTAEHLLPIGSASKAFTATCAVMLAAEGKLDLDKPIRDYIPELKLSDPVAGAHATTRDMLCHRTGMPRHDLSWINNNDFTRREIVSERLQHLAPSKPFRSVWQYQNYMFATVGYLVEVISGKTWEEFTKERIFGPLKMKTANFLVKNPDKSGKTAKLYTENKKGKLEETVPLVIDAMGPAGSINATVEEMCEWLLFNIDGGKAHGKQLIDEKTFPELHKPNISYELMPFEVPETKKMGYALGWFVNCFRGNKVVEHGGNVAGASALVSTMPDKGLGVVVLTNAAGTQLTQVLVNQVYDELLGHDDIDWVDFFAGAVKPLKEAAAKQQQAFLDSKIKGKKKSHDTDDYVGEYTHPGYGAVYISKENTGDGLRIKYNYYESELTHLHYDIFHFVHFGMTIPASFRTGISGDIDTLCIQFEGMVPPTEFRKKAVEKKAEPAEKPAKAPVKRTAKK